MLRHADRARAPRRAVIVGPRDHEAGVATVRDMATGEQEQVPLGARRASGGGAPVIGSPRYRTHTCLGAPARPGRAGARGRLGAPPARPRRRWCSWTCATAAGSLQLVFHPEEAPEAHARRRRGCTRRTCVSVEGAAGRAVRRDGQPAPADRRGRAAA